jgi:AcrR family transcriptional regulator
MSYEVIKTIRGRKYRYEVESYRDPETGKVRNKWRYAGKAEGGAPPKARRRADETRASLTNALERILETTLWHDITVSAIARAANVADATFYRYYRSRNDVLLACAQRLFAEGDVQLAALLEIAETPSAERLRLRAWANAIVGNPHGSAVFFALWVSGGAADLRQLRLERRREIFHDYLLLLEQSGYIAMGRDAIGLLATELALLIQAFGYRTIVDRRPLSDVESVAVAAMIERLVWGSAQA